SAAQRFFLQATFEVDQLALRTAAAKLALLDGCDAGRIVAPIFKPLQGVHDKRRHGFAADDPDNSAHSPTPHPFAQAIYAGGLAPDNSHSSAHYVSRAARLPG